MRIVDAHTHLQFPQYDADRDAVIQRLRDNDIVAINVGTDRRSSEAAVAFADAYGDEFYATIGQHPTDTNEQFDDAFYEELAKHPRVVAIGECGLDYFHEKEPIMRERQKELFIQQIEFAFRIDKPLMIHCREAFQDLIHLLQLNTRKLKPEYAGVAHFFSGTKKDAEQLMDLGFSFSFGGVLTFTHDYDPVIDMIPLERILLETDAPYVAPAPYRGKRNEPSFIIETAQRLAELKGVSYDKLVSQTKENAERIFGIQI